MTSSAFLKGELLRPDGSERFDIAAEGAVLDAERFGARRARDLAARRRDRETRFTGYALPTSEPLLALPVR